MANWNQKYQEKLLSADAAAGLIKSGDRMYWGLAHGAVVALDKALAKRADELRDVEVYTILPLRKGPFETYKACQSPEQVRFHCCHYGGTERKMAAEGGCWFLPIQFRELPKYWSENTEPFDVVAFQVRPMDQFGNFNIGPQVSDVWGAMKHAKKVIVEVNENMPYAHGHQVALNIDQVDHVIEGENPALIEVPRAAASELEIKMAKNIVGMIESGSTLQLGIGGIPNTIGTLLCEADVEDLSVHTEMLVDAYLDLYEAGKITGNKNLDKGKMVYTFTGGSKKLYDFIHNNPVACCGPVDYVNAVEVACQNDKLISINSCVQVDLYGQVNAESIGYKQISGTGGQLDYVLAAFLSKGGKSFLCTPSSRVNADGTRESLIVPAMPAGSIITTPRSATHFVVTEYGAVNLKGKSTWERAELLISIAHPDFHQELIANAEKMGIWRKSNKKI